MMNSNTTSSRFASSKTVLIALGCALSLVSLPVSVIATETASLHPLADKAAALPVTTTFEKVKSGENAGQYVLHVKNTSHAALKVSTTVLPSVKFHADAKSRSLPKQTIAAGKAWKIDGLAAADKVTLSADGFEPLELTVP